MKELDHELRATIKALGEKTLKSKIVNETLLAGLLDQYSERLVSIFDEKLRLSMQPGTTVEDKTPIVEMSPIPQYSSM